MAKDYSNYTKEELLEEVKRLKKRKKYGIVWEEQIEEVAEQCKKELPVLQEVKEREISKAPDKPINLLIEGDNYHVLSVLNYTHQRKIDVIYIDPPYNTGNQSWKYNNNYVDKDDSYKHSKWLSFMYKRLKLAKNLLKEDGIIIVTIDDYEVANLNLLMNDIFGEKNKLAAVTIIHTPAGRSDRQHFASSHEYALFYAFNHENCETYFIPLSEEDKEKYNKEDEISFYREKSFRRTGKNSTPDKRPNLFYPIFYNQETHRISVEKQTDSNWHEILPIDSKGKERVWRWGKDTLMECWQTELVVKKQEGNLLKLVTKTRIMGGKKSKTVWTDSKYDASPNGTILLQKLLNEDDIFDYPKSIYAVLDVLQICTREKKNAVILDFFAGSGTTGHAVALLNKRDSGNRQFILSTNNENRIADEVCYPRIKAIINKNDEVPELTGLNLNLKYLKTDFVPSSPIDSNKFKLTEKATEMLCLREETFDEVKLNPYYKIFKNKEKHIGIIFNEYKIEEFKKEAKKINSNFIVYIFSLTNDSFDERFDDMKNMINLLPIPEAILQVYRKIFKGGNNES